MGRNGTSEHYKFVEISTTTYVIAITCLSFVVEGDTWIQVQAFGLLLSNLPRNLPDSYLSLYTMYGPRRLECGDAYGEDTVQLEMLPPNPCRSTSTKHEWTRPRTQRERDHLLTKVPPLCFPLRPSSSTRTLTRCALTCSLATPCALPLLPYCELSWRSHRCHSAKILMRGLRLA